MTLACMIDIETLSTRHDALVLSIGVVPFSTHRDGGKQIPLLGTPTLIIPTLRDQLSAYGRHVDQETQRWWADPARGAARVHWEIGADEPVRAALRKLADAVDDATEIWARGPHFDITILETLYRQAGVRVPWKYNIVRDTRTAFQIKPRPVSGTVYTERELIPHHPVDDCIAEIYALWDAEIEA